MRAPDRLQRLAHHVRRLLLREGVKIHCVKDISPRHQLLHQEPSAAARLVGHPESAQQLDDVAVSQPTHDCNLTQDQALLECVG